MTPIERMRKICKDLPDVTESPHYGDVMFKSRGLPFASIGDKHGAMQVVVRLEPAHVEAVLATDPQASRYERAKDCVAIDITKATDWNALETLVLSSFHLATTANKKPAKARKKTPKKRTKE